MLSVVLLVKHCPSYFKGRKQIGIKSSNLFRAQSMKVAGLNLGPILTPMAHVRGREQWAKGLKFTGNS